MPYLYDTFKQQAECRHEKKALICNDHHYSYGDLLRLADECAVTLFCATEQRPRVALLCDDPLYNIVVSLAVSRLDGVCIPTNAQMVPEQLQAAWLASDVNVVVYEPLYARKVDACDGDTIRFLACDSLNDAREETTAKLLPEQFSWSGDEDFLITLSSGSTGEPKPIVLTQRVKVARAQQTWQLYGLGADDVVLCASPFFHSLGQRLVYVPLLLGATLVHLSTFTPRQWLAQVEQHQVSFVIAVSSHLYALKHYLLENAAQLRSLNTIVTSSAPIDSHFKEQLFQAVGCAFHEIYGATEVAIASDLAPADAVEKYMTVGRPCDGVEIKIVSDVGEEQPLHEIGEIAVKSPLAFSGYYARPELTQAAFKDGYFLTGDLGTLDGDGFLSYVSRKKDVIISGGINIYPGDIERELAKHPEVNEVAVIGVDDELLGEVVVAVCISDGAEGVESGLRQMANRHLAPYQRPIKYFFQQQLPLTPSGKIAKQVLREQYNAMNDGWTQVLRAMLYGE